MRRNLVPMLMTLVAVGCFVTLVTGVVAGELSPETAQRIERMRERGSRLLEQANTLSAEADLIDERIAEMEAIDGTGGMNRSQRAEVASMRARQVEMRTQAADLRQRAHAIADEIVNLRYRDSAVRPDARRVARFQRSRGAIGILSAEDTDADADQPEAPDGDTDDDTAPSRPDHPHHPHPGPPGWQDRVPEEWGPTRMSRGSRMRPEQSRHWGSPGSTPRIMGDSDGDDDGDDGDDGDVERPPIDPERGPAQGYHPKPGTPEWDYWRHNYRGPMRMSDDSDDQSSEPPRRMSRGSRMRPEQSRHWGSPGARSRIMSDSEGSEDDDEWERKIREELYRIGGQAAVDAYEEQKRREEEDAEEERKRVEEFLGRSQ